jgi:hypothetical protein
VNANTPAKTAVARKIPIASQDIAFACPRVGLNCQESQLGRHFGSGMAADGKEDGGTEEDRTAEQVGHVPG